MSFDWYGFINFLAGVFGGAILIGLVWYKHWQEKEQTFFLNGCCQKDQQRYLMYLRRMN